MGSLVMMVHTLVQLISNLNWLQVELCIEYKVHLVSNHRLFNKIKLQPKILTQMRHSSALLQVVPIASTGLVRVLVKMKPPTLKNWGQFFALVPLSTRVSKKEKKQRNSGQLLVVKQHTVLLKKWASPQDSKPDFSMFQMLKDLCI